MATNTIRLHRVLRATPERVYRAFLDADAMAKWLPPNGFTGKVHHLEPTVGGRYKMSFTNFTTGMSHSFGGEFLALQRRVGADGFEANWAVSSLVSAARGQLAQLKAEPGLPKADAAQALDSFDVSLVEPLNVYALSSRAVKYAPLLAQIVGIVDPLPVEFAVRRPQDGGQQDVFFLSDGAAQLAILPARLAFDVEDLRLPVHDFEQYLSRVVVFYGVVR